jgi:protoporphyrinogen oxidase
MALEDELQQRERVAIIGTGLTGLHAAYRLCETSALRQRFDVDIFEEGDDVGLDGSSITYEGNRVDVPMRSFNAGEYK